MRGLLYIRQLLRSVKTKSKYSIKSKSAFGYLFIAPFFAIFLAFSLYPILSTLYISLTSWKGYGPEKFVGLNNYIRILSDNSFINSLLVNFLIIIIVNPIQIAFALLIAIFLNNRLVRMKGYLQTSLFLPFVTMPMVIGMIMIFLFEWKGGTVNQILLATGIIRDGVFWFGYPWSARFVMYFTIFWRYLGYIAALWLAGIVGIPTEYYEAAEIDGANAFQKFCSVTLPFLKPVMIFIIIQSISGGFQLFDEPFMIFMGKSYSSSMVGGPEYSCFTVVWNIFDTAFGRTTRLGYASAMSYSLFFVITFLSIIIYQVMGKERNKV